MNYVVMLAYNKTDVVEAAINRLLNRTKDFRDFHFIIVDPSYPLNEEDQSIWKLYVKYAVEFPTTTYLKIDNDGVAGNYNQVIQHFIFQDNDVIHFFDPDNNPRENNYLQNMIAVLQDPKVAYVTLERPDPDVPYGKHVTIDNIECYQIYRGHSWPCGAFRADFLKQAYPINQDNGKWGYIEDWLYREFCRQDKIGLFLKGFVDQMIDGTNQGLGGQDHLYLKYQVDCAMHITQELFEDWLTKRLAIN
jgi:GT2 family glycosyltransferase